LIAQLLSMLKNFSVGDDLTARPIGVPDGFEGRDTGIERFQATSLKHSDILLKVNDIEDPVMRLVQVVKWMLTLGQAFQSKKPLNPILGEVSICKFYSNQPKEGNKNDGKHKNDDDKDVFYSIAEQISHHPPMSTIVTENKERGIRITGDAKANIRFLGTAIKLQFEGKTSVAFEKFNEVYSFVPPPVMIRLIGFVLEYGGQTEISCTGHPYCARISFKEKPYLRGQYHRLKGSIVKVDGGAEEDVVQFKGHWNQEVEFYDLRNKQKFKFESKDYPARAGIPTYPDIEDEIPESSRKVWRALKSAPDGSAVTKAKREVEEEQRRKAKERTETGKDHQPRFYELETNAGETKVWKLKPGSLQSVAF